MKENNQIKPYAENAMYYDYNETVCPVCGGRIKHPYTGSVTIEQLDEDSECCLWQEVIDEGDSTIGFKPLCRNIHPYTMESEQHQYIHYDLLELVNSWAMSIEDKVSKLTEYLCCLLKPQGVEKEDIIITVCDNSISNVTINKPIEKLSIELYVDDYGQICLKAV